MAGLGSKGLNMVCDGILRGNCMFERGVCLFELGECVLERGKVVI